MKRLSYEKQEIWEDLQAMVKFFNPAPPEIQKKGLDIFLMPSRLWESTWVLDKIWGGGNKVLDVACGNPGHMIWLGIMGYEYTGIDPKFAGDNLPLFRQYLQRTISHADTLRRLNILPMRMEEIQWVDEFDFVISLSAMEQIDLSIVKKGIPLMMRALKPGGRMLLTIDQKLTHDRGKTYDPWYGDKGSPQVPLTKYYEEIILALEQAPVHGWNSPGLYHNLQEYLDRNPGRWASDFPEFRNQPYGLEFIKKGFTREYNIEDGYTDKIWYDEPQRCEWEDYKIERLSLERINKFYYNIADVIKQEARREGKFWSQSKTNEVVSSLKAGEKLDMIQIERNRQDLHMYDGFHRAFVLQRMFGLDLEIPVVTKRVE